MRELGSGRFCRNGSLRQNHLDHFCRGGLSQSKPSPPSNSPAPLAPWTSGRNWPRPARDGSGVVAAGSLRPKNARPARRGRRGKLDASRLVPAVNVFSNRTVAPLPTVFISTFCPAIHRRKGATVIADAVAGTPCGAAHAQKRPHNERRNRKIFRMHAIKSSRFNEPLPAACLRRATNVQFTRPNPNMSARAHRVARGTYPLRAPEQTTCAKNKHCCSKASAWHEEFKLDSTSLSDKLTPLGHEATASRLLSSKDPTKRHSVSTGQHWWTCSRGRLDTFRPMPKPLGNVFLHAFSPRTHPRMVIAAVVATPRVR